MNMAANQRLAIGAVTLSAVIACSPGAGKTGEAAPAPGASRPETSKATVIAMPPPSASEPGYAGGWAPLVADCSDAKKTFLLSAEVLNLTPQARNCAVRSIAEEHPTGRSAIYRIRALCIGGTAAGREDLITLNFGASDTVMQMQVDSDPPLTLERCPVVATP
jgi:hypothetical protein